MLSGDASLHPGEIEPITICKHRNYLFVTDDKKAKNYCDKEGINYFDLHDILRHLFKSKTLSREEIIHLMREIEEKDYRKIKGKKKILK